MAYLTGVSANGKRPWCGRGRRQAETQRDVLGSERFLATEQPEVILHSPLIRARETCLTLFGGPADGGPPLEQFDELYERSVSEHLFRSWLEPRVGRFAEHLRSRPVRARAFPFNCQPFNTVYR
jgi:broad specificity phosphatase PhoE